MIAGPSEVLILADSSANPAWIAADLLAQAEHDTAAQSILVTDSAGTRRRGRRRSRQLATLPRKDIAGASWRDFGAIVLVRSLRDAIPSPTASPPNIWRSWRRTPRRWRPRAKRRRDLHRQPHARKPSAIMSAAPTMCCRARSARFFFRPRRARFHEAHVHSQVLGRSLAVLGPSAIALGGRNGSTRMRARSPSD